MNNAAARWAMVTCAAVITTGTLCYNIDNAGVCIVAIMAMCFLFGMLGYAAITTEEA